MKHEKLIEKHLGVNTPYWIKENVDNAINEALRQHFVDGSLPRTKCECGQNSLPYKAQIEIDKCSRCDNDY